MTKTLMTKAPLALLLIFYIFGMATSSFLYDVSNETSKFEENSSFRPKNSQIDQFDDEKAVIVSYFEENLDDVYDHATSSNGMSYTDVTDPGTWNDWVDASKGGDWVTFDTNHLGETQVAQLHHVYDADPDNEVAKATFNFDVPLENPIIKTRIALGSNDDGYINFATYTAEMEFLQVVQFRTNGRVRPYDSVVTELVDDITDSTEWLDIRLEIIGTTHYDLYINDELVGNNYRNYMLHAGQISYVGFYGGVEEDNFEGYCAYVKVNAAQPPSKIEGEYSAIIDSGADYARWYDTVDYSQGTIECFFRPTVVPLTDGTVYYILNGGDGTSPMIGVYMQNGTLKAYHFSTDWQRSPHIFSSTILESGELYHIAFSFGSLGTHLYINGIEENSSSDTRTLNTLNRYIGIGKIVSVNPTGTFSAIGVYDLFRWSLVQRTSFPTISDFIDYSPPATPTSISDPPTTNEPVYYDDSDEYGTLWIPLILVGGGIVGLIVIIGPKRRAPAVLRSHEPVRTAQLRPVSAQNPREMSPEEAAETTRVEAFPRKRFCNWCGEPLFDYVDGITFCPNCGKRL